MKCKKNSIHGNALLPGEIIDEQFYLLIDISKIRSLKVINALRNYFVKGLTRAEVCDLYKVNPGYLSIKIREFQELWRRMQEYCYYFNVRMGE